ncbi:MAG: Disaggregatase related repeat, partial [Actinomycetota bacterium]|nr:Disaggregatase related repeat [Actinomycetota bacterium]
SPSQGPSVRHNGIRRAAFLLVIATWLATMAQAEAGFAAGLTVASGKLTVYRTCTLGGTIAASTAMFETYVDENTPTTNNGAATTMDAQSAKNKNRRSYISFDLTKCSPTIPSSATVDGATLRLWVTAIASTCRTEDIYPATASWTEGAITWNNQPFGTTLNNPSTASRTDGITIGSAACTYTAAAQYVSWTVTTDVASFVAGTLTNNGWMIRDDSEDVNPGKTTTFGTSDAASVPQAPQLVVTYAT